MSYDDLKVLEDGDMCMRGKMPEAETPCEDRSGYCKVARVVIIIEVTIRHKLSRNPHITLPTTLPEYDLRALLRPQTQECDTKSAINQATWFIQIGKNLSRFS